jgi:hypothetical protein
MALAVRGQAHLRFAIEADLLQHASAAIMVLSLRTGNTNRRHAALYGEEAMATFVLVHGSWAGSVVWRELAPRLRKAGHEVYAPTLTGIGACKHLLSVTLISTRIFKM